MEVLLRCELSDVPGMLATLAGAVAEASGDIQAVEIVGRSDGKVIDDLWVRTRDLRALVSHVKAVDGVKLIHAGPSRGLPIDSTIRLATGIETLLSGAATPEQGVTTVIGGLLHASSAEMVPVAERPSGKNRRVLALPVNGKVLVLQRDYRFHDAEAHRARRMLAVLETAASIGAALTGTP